MLFAGAAKKAVSFLLLICFLFVFISNINNSALALEDDNSIELNSSLPLQIFVSFEEEGTKQELSNVKPQAMQLESDQNIFEYIVQGLENLETSIYVANFEVERTDEFYAILYEYFSNSLNLFHIESITVYAYSSSLIITRVVPTYTFSSIDEYHEQKQTFNTAVSNILAKIPKTVTDAEKALAVHDALILHIEKYTTAVNNNLYGAIVNRETACHGYTLAYNYLLNLLDVETLYVLSISLNHAWSMVKIEDDWLHVDLTWDNPSAMEWGRVRHKNFLLSDSGAKDTGHSNWITITPEATNTNYERYFWKNVNSQFIYNYNEKKWFYICFSNPNINHQMMYLDYNNEELETLFSFRAGWSAGSIAYYSRSPYIAQYNQYIFYNTNDSIYFFDMNDPTYKRTLFCKDPDLSGTQGIYEMKIEGNYLYYYVKESIYGSTRLWKKSFDLNNISLNQSSATIPLDETFNLKVDTLPVGKTVAEIEWSSSDTDIVKVENGVVTGVGIGFATITATTVDGLFSASCDVYVIDNKILLPAEGSGCFIDYEKNLIYGLQEELSSLQNYVVAAEGATLEYSQDILGTGTQVTASNSYFSQIYTIVIIGDLDGDSICDGNDAVILSAIYANFQDITKLSDELFLAADCNKDGVINAEDIFLLEQCGLKLDTITQKVYV